MTVTNDGMARTAHDPHHDGCNEWGWDGRDLYHRTIGHKKWVKTRRVHPTPARIAVLHQLMKIEAQP